MKTKCHLVKLLSNVLNMLKKIWKKKSLIYIYELIYFTHKIIINNENIIIKYSIFITYHHTVLYITIKNKR